MDFLRVFWDAAVELDPKASSLHEADRFPDASPEALEQLFDNSDFVEIEMTLGSRYEFS